MSVTDKDIGWGAYKEWEGPFYRGRLKYQLPSFPDFGDRCLAVITSTEGGAYDAVNMYDRCILSVGLIQWCERNLSFSGILGRCAEMDKYMVDNVISKMPMPNTEFKKLPQGWRFTFGGVVVESELQQRALFLGNAGAGKKGTWTTALKGYAKKVAACMANLWEYPVFRVAQAEATKKKLMGFVLPEANQILFAQTGLETEFYWRGALKAMFLSFAANLPTVANKSLQAAAQHPQWATSDWADRFRLAAQAMTFGPNIAIYPHRYEAVAPVLGRLFGVQVPRTAAELKDWEDAPPEVLQVPLNTEEQKIADRLIQLSDDVRMGRNNGLDAIEALFKEDQHAAGTS